MEEIAQVLNIPKSLNHSQLLCNITHSYFCFPDIDECFDNSTNDFDTNANCTNTAGSYNCQCLGGSQVMEEIAHVINQTTKCPKTLSVQRVLIYALTNVLEYSDFLLKC